MDLAPVRISRDSSVPALRVNSSENRAKQDTALTSLFILQVEGKGREHFIPKLIFLK